MTNTYVDKSYAYAVARLRHAELKLLDSAALEQLISARSTEDAVKLLKDRGWGSDESDDLDEICSKETKKLWEYVDEIVPDINVFNVFRLQNDFNNLKAALKESVMTYDYPGIYAENGTVPAEMIRDAVKSRNYKNLPVYMSEIAEKAHEIFLRTGDGQLCDIMVDKACLDAIRNAGAESGDSFIAEYAELKVAAADINIAIRSCITRKDRDFMTMAIADSGIMSTEGLITATISGIDAAGAFLASTDFAGAVQELKKSPAAFERWCDNLITDRMQSMHYEAFGPGPIAAYIIARENEIKSVRIILSGKQNGFPDSKIRERMRDTYV
ncbi:MAG: V-type ATPase subunit [Eubacteriales bacterium]|nr:V-type ATPase subunit [Eubacteriales bacterium]